MEEKKRKIKKTLINKVVKPFSLAYLPFPFSSSLSLLSYYDQLSLQHHPMFYNFISFTISHLFQFPILSSFFPLLQPGFYFFIRDLVLLYNYANIRFMIAPAAAFTNGSPLSFFTASPFSSNRRNKYSLVSNGGPHATYLITLPTCSFLIKL